jgi:hypothetical protein
MFHYCSNKLGNGIPHIFLLFINHSLQNPLFYSRKQIIHIIMMIKSLIG